MTESNINVGDKVVVYRDGVPCALTSVERVLKTKIVLKNNMTFKRGRNYNNGYTMSTNLEDYQNARTSFVFLGYVKSVKRVTYFTVGTFHKLPEDDKSKILQKMKLMSELAAEVENDLGQIRSQK